MNPVGIMEDKRVGPLPSAQMPLISILTAFLQAGHGRNGLNVGEVITLFAQSLHHIQNALEEVRDYSSDASMLAHLSRYGHVGSKFF